MKRAVSLLLALALASAGCVEMPMWTDAKPPTKGPATFTAEPPPVQPDQVNDANARQAMDALRNELNRAADAPASTLHSDR